MIDCVGQLGTVVLLDLRSLVPSPIQGICKSYLERVRNYRDSVVAQTERLPEPAVAEDVAAAAVINAAVAVAETVDIAAVDELEFVLETAEAC